MNVTYSLQMSDGEDRRAYWRARVGRVSSRRAQQSVVGQDWVLYEIPPYAPTLSLVFIEN